jgi:ribosomal protein L7Ae-like RNA K-turn-binding protein
MLPDEIMGLLGLAQRAGKVIAGTTAVANELRRPREILLIFAEDFSASTREKLLASASRRPQVLQIGTMAEWGKYFGRQQVGVIAVSDKNFVAGILKKMKP